jgi:hypothetical protein
MSQRLSDLVLVPLEVVADRLCYTGSDRERSVRRLFSRHGVPIIRRGRGIYFVTELQYAALIEAMTTFSPSGSAAKNSTSGGRSGWGGKRASSKSTLQAAIAEKMPKHTSRSSKRISATKPFTVVEGGRSA